MTTKKRATLKPSKKSAQKVAGKTVPADNVTNRKFRDTISAYIERAGGCSVPDLLRAFPDQFDEVCKRCGMTPQKIRDHYGLSPDKYVSKEEQIQQRRQEQAAEIAARREARGG